MNINPINLYNTQNMCGFGKKLLEKTNVRKPWNDVERVKFFEYDPKNKKDRKQIYDLKHKIWGRSAKYINEIEYSFSRMTKGSAPEKPIKQQYFGLENRYGRTLAIAQVQSSDKKLRLGELFFENVLKITYIQTKPSEMFTSDQRQYEGLGEVLVSKIVQQAKKDGRNSVILYSTNDNFWISSGFFQPVPEAKRRGYNTLRLKAEDFDKYIKFVENKANFENPYLDIYV